MFVKEERVGLIVYLYYNRDAKKLATVGDVVYHSKKRRYLQLYVKQEEASAIQERLAQEKYVKQVRFCHIKDLDKDFVGSLYRTAER